MVLSCLVMSCHVWTTEKIYSLFTCCVPELSSNSTSTHQNMEFYRECGLYESSDIRSLCFFTGCTWLVIAWSQDCSRWWHVCSLTCQESFQDFRKAEHVILGCTCWDFQGRPRRRANEDDQQVEKCWKNVSLIKDTILKLENFAKFPPQNPFITRESCGQKNRILGHPNFSPCGSERALVAPFSWKAHLGGGGSSCSGFCGPENWIFTTDKGQKDTKSPRFFFLLPIKSHLKIGHFCIYFSSLDFGVLTPTVCVEKTL